MHEEVKYYTGIFPTVNIVGKIGPSGWRDKLNRLTTTWPRPKNLPIPDLVEANLE